ncbi:hypothetical protein GW868_00050 [archaeon]|nr:hypothetical protein [archaeon]
MKDKETRKDIEDIKEASKSRDFFDILRKRQRRNVITEAYRETEQAENAFFEERAQKHETESILDKPIVKKSIITGIFLLVLIALIVLAFVFFMQQQIDIDIKFGCASPDDGSNRIFCSTIIIPKNNLTIIDVWLHADVIKSAQCNFENSIFNDISTNWARIIATNITANQEYNCIFEIASKTNTASKAVRATLNICCPLNENNTLRCIEKKSVAL